MGLALTLSCAKAATSPVLLTVAQAAKRHSPIDGRAGCGRTTEVMCAPIAH